MNQSPHAFEYVELKQAPVFPVCVLCGDEPLLKRLVLQRLLEVIFADEEEAPPYSNLDPDQVDWRDVADELATASLFGPSARVVVLRSADDFVTKYRSQLETYVEAPSASSTLILDVKSWPGNTRLAKAVAKTGLTVACKVPEKKAGSSIVVDTVKLQKWVAHWAKSRHGLKLKANAVTQLLELVGTELGLIDQELAKLALSVDNPKQEVDVETLVSIVGGWRTKTTWDLLDAACDGNAAEALQQLDRILMAGEHPQALFGAFSWSLRRFAAATRHVERMERDGQRPQLMQCLEAAGFRRYPQGALQRAQTQILQLGRVRAGQIYRWLLETDLMLKGSHASPARARFAMELLILRLASEKALRRR